ncbi:hypothetical protein AVEN_197015-1 [Araneus ventricosus]|uniref:Uncharacterized protein n=1 Tax=Araneus ventricosus TaxID=182803 RepID=A0A4Y2EBQ4_ARAVE|nr:hypothetical protein AVEN_197015-1 [Araneus ventricosus]
MHPIPPLNGPSHAKRLVSILQTTADGEIEIPSHYAAVPTYFIFTIHSPLVEERLSTLKTKYRSFNNIPGDEDLIKSHTTKSHTPA